MFIWKTFQRLSVIGKDAARYHTNQYVKAVKLSPAFYQSVTFDNKQLQFSKTPLVTFSPKSINLDLDLPRNNFSIKNIIESPLKIKHEIENPLKVNIKKIDITTEKSMDLPTFNNGVNVIMAKRRKIRSIIVIRRKKVKKDKRKKYRKLYAAETRKIQKRRTIRKEKAFQAELWQKVKLAQKFDAKEYVASRIHLLNRKLIPPVYKGYILPESTVKKFMEEDERRKAKRKEPKFRLKL